MVAEVKLLILIHNMEIAGAQCVVRDLLKGLMDDGQNVKLILVDQHKDNRLINEIREMGIEVRYKVRKNSGFLMRKIEVYCNLASILKDEKADVIHAHLDVWYVWLYALLHKKRIIETIHSQPYRIKSLWTSFMFRMLSKFDLIRPVLLSKSNADEFAELFHVDRKGLDIIPNPVDLEKFRWAGEERVPDGNGTIRFTFVARFHPVKNHHMLLEAFCKALNSVSNIRLQLAGTGELIECEKIHAKQLGITDHVIFLGEVSDIPNLLKHTDVCVISSDSECFPLALLESMASGLPVIATSVGGMRDIVKDNGVMVPMGEVSLFANAIIGLAQNGDMRKKYGRRSFELVQEYALAKVTRQYEQLYQNEYQRLKSGNQS